MVILLSGNALTIVASVVVFLFVTILLVILLLYAKKKLMPEGIASVSINKGENKFDVDMGGTLLSALSENEIFLPAACGGAGTCGLCRCQIVEGGGAILPTEVGFFSRKEIRDHWRLACQAKIKNNMEVKVSESALGVKKWECEVVSNKNVTTFIKDLILRLPEGEHLNFLAGEYIQFDIPAYELKYTDFNIEKEFHSNWKKFKMWDLTVKNDEPTVRAYSMANYPAEDEIILNIRIAIPPFDRSSPTGFKSVPTGIASSYLFNLKPGDKITASGPFGDFYPILDSGREMMYIGRGAGMAPLRSHIFHLLKTLNVRDRKITYWYEVRSKEDIFYEEEFRALEKEFPNFTFNLALRMPLPEDNWTGYIGLAHDVIYKNYLINHDAPEDIEYYMCGPSAMAKSMQTMLNNLGVPDEMIMFDDFG